MREARVTVGGETVGAIAHGLFVLLGIGLADGEREALWMARKLLALRIFEDPRGKLNLGLTEVQGSLLLVSQFTLYGDVERGNRPSFGAAMAPRAAERLYRRVIELCAASAPVAEGRFGEDMQIALVADGPITLLLEAPAAAGPQ